MRFALGEVDLAFVAGDAVNGFEDENRVWGDEGAAGFRDDVREGDVTFFADLFDVRDDVAGVAFHAVVHGGLIRRTTAIVVDT